MLEDGLYNYLANNATVITAVGINPVSLTAQVYADMAPFNAAFPYIVYTIVSGNPVYSFNGDSGLNRDRVQFDVYAKNPNDRGRVVKLLKGLLSGLSNSRMGEYSIQYVQLNNKRGSVIPPIDKSDLGTWRMMLEFFFWYDETQPLLA